jgi:hypothetical protein
MGLDPMGALVAAHRPWPDITRSMPLCDPFGFAAERRHIPPSTAATKRSRTSIERAFVMRAGLLHQPTS